MSANVLIPMDGLELTGKAVQDGIALAKRVRAKSHGADDRLEPCAAQRLSRL